LYEVVVALDDDQHAACYFRGVHVRDLEAEGFAICMQKASFSNARPARRHNLAPEHHDGRPAASLALVVASETPTSRPTPNGS
jgi:hypothetical protein